MLSESVEDLLTIVTSFTGKLYGMRSCEKIRLVQVLRSF